MIYISTTNQHARLQAQYIPSATPLHVHLSKYFTHKGYIVFNAAIKYCISHEIIIITKTI